MLKDFKAFVTRGNVLDLAVAVILGASFGAIVTSMVNDIVMPPIGLILHHVDFKDLFVCLNGHSYPDSGGRQSRVGAGPGLRPVSEYGDQLPDRRSGRLHRGAGCEQAAARAGPTRRQHQGLRLLLYADSDSGDALPALHVPVDGLRTQYSRRFPRRSAACPQRSRARNTGSRGAVCSSAPGGSMLILKFPRPHGRIRL